MIKFLLTSRGDPRQSVRLRRFLLASTGYAVCLPLLALAYGFGLIARGPALLVGVLSLSQRPPRWPGVRWGIAAGILLGLALDLTGANAESIGANSGK